MATAVNEFQAALTELANRSVAAVDRVIAGLDRLTGSEVFAFLSDAYPTVLDPYLAAAGKLTAQWYDEQPVAAPARGAARFAAEPIELPPAEQLAGSARWAGAQKSPSKALAGASTRHVFNTSRQTVVYNADREGARWVRHAQPTACGFCRMLATRVLTATDDYGKTGSLYVSKRSAKPSPHNRKQIEITGHDHCHCVAMPLRDGGVEYTPPAYVEQWTADYYAAREAGADNPLDIAKALEAADDKRSSAPTPPPPAAEPDPAPIDYAEVGRRLDEQQRPAPVALDEPVDTELDAIDTVLAEATAALEAGDDDRAMALFDKAEKLEAKRNAKAAKAAAKLAAEEADVEEKSGRVLALIDQGWRPDEAEAEVYGVTVDSIRRRNFIAAARADGHAGKGFDELLTSVHFRLTDEQFWRAEADTNGNLVKRKYIGRFSGRNLWTVNDRTARKYMSEEMAAWFDANGGRLTRSIMREAILAGRDYYDLTQQEDYYQ